MSQYFSNSLLPVPFLRIIYCNTIIVVKVFPLTFPSLFFVLLPRISQSFLRWHSFDCIQCRRIYYLRPGEPFHGLFNCSPCYTSCSSNIRAVVVDSHIQRFVLATEETTVTHQITDRPFKCQSRSWSQRGTKVDGPHHDDDPLLKPARIQIAATPLPGPNNREHGKRIGVKTMSSGTNYSLYCMECCQYSKILRLR